MRVHLDLTALVQLEANLFGGQSSQVTLWAGLN